LIRNTGGQELYGKKLSRSPEINERIESSRQCGVKRYEKRYEDENQ